MRVTDKMGYNQVIGNLQKNRGEMAELQSEAALQKKVTKPSDDPVGSARVLGHRTEQRGNEQFIKNINMAKSFLDFTDVSLGEASEVFMRLKELAVQQANDAGASPETRRTVAEEVGQSFKELVQIGNRKLGERYVFGGHQTTKAPFTSAGEYNGDDGDLKLHVGKGSWMAMNLPGDKVFMGKGAGADGEIRPSEVQPKTAKELEDYKVSEHERQQHNVDIEHDHLRIRGPAASVTGAQVFKSEYKSDTEGINVLDAVKKFEIALKVNDKNDIQESIDNLDQCIAQVVHARAQVGGRIQTLNHAEASLRQHIQDSQAAASKVEDVDLFALASDMNKADSALKASLETSGKIITPSLLDFLK